MHITVQQIEVFLAVASSRSISAAARDIYISQPAVSSVITEMERKLGLKLLTRSNRGAELTAEGRRLYAELDPIYKRFEVATSRVFDDKGASVTDMLNIGALHTPDAIRFMLAAAEKHREMYPSRTVTTEYFNNSELRSNLLCEKLDIVFTFSFEIMGNPDLDCRRLHTLRQYFVMPSAYCDIDGSNFRFLRDKTLLLEVSSGREVMLNICNAHGFEPMRIKYVDSYLMLAQMIADGEGFTIGGRNLPNLSQLAPHIAFVPVAVADCNEYIHLVASWRQGDERPEIRNFIDVIEMPEVYAKASHIQEAPGSKWYSMT